MTKMHGLPRLSAEDIATGKHPLGPVQAQSAAGMPKGSYVVLCDTCRGSGYVRYGQRSYEDCQKCEGKGALVVYESESQRKPSQFGWKLAALAILVCLFGLAWIFFAG